MDARNGRVTVDYLSTRQRKTLQVPHFGFAINGTSSSWDRYMPQANEVVTVNHEMDGTPHITTYTPYGDGSAGVGGHNLPGHGGYAEVADLTKAKAPGLGYNFVELRPGADTKAEDIIAWCRQHLARFKCPRYVTFVELPKTSTGKIQKFKLRELAKDV